MNYPYQIEIPEHQDSPLNKGGLRRELSRTKQGVVFFLWNENYNPLTPFFKGDFMPPCNTHK